MQLERSRMLVRTIDDVLNDRIVVNSYMAVSDGLLVEYTTWDKAEDLRFLAPIECKSMLDSLLAGKARSVIITKIGKRYVFV